MTHIFSPRVHMLALFFSPFLYLRKLPHSQQSRGVLLLLGSRKSRVGLLTKGPALFLAERAAWSDSLGGVLASPQPELYLFNAQINHLLSEMHFMPPSVRLTQKVSSARQQLHSPLHCRQDCQEAEGGCHSSLDKDGLAIVAEIPKVGGYEI